MNFLGKKSFQITKINTKLRIFAYYHRKISSNWLMQKLGHNFQDGYIFFKIIVQNILVGKI